MYYVIRFLADNPDVWLFYCHIDWHMMQGLAMTFIEAPRELQDNLVIPDDHIKVCEAAGVPYQGNAAANTEDCRNLKGENKPPGFIPAGFTAPGIAALVFSCICPIMGMVAISIYGMSGLKSPVRKPGSDDGNTSMEMEVTSRVYRD